MFKHDGEQIKYLREKMGLNRSQFSKKYGISSSTLKYIEAGHLKLNENRITFFRKVFIEVGFNFCNSNENNNNYEDNSNFFSNIDKSDIKIKQEIDFFKESNSNHVLLTIQNNSMYPIYCVGDIIGGIKVIDTNLYQKLEGSFCIISDNDNDKFVGRVVKSKNNSVQISPYNHDDCSKNPIIEIKNVTSIAPITRHWCLYGILKNQ